MLSTSRIGLREALPEILEGSFIPDKTSLTM